MRRQNLPTGVKVLFWYLRSWRIALSLRLWQAIHPPRYATFQKPPSPKFEHNSGKDYLILAHRPFAAANPYAETGPIFLCADDCAAAPHAPELPAILRSEQYIVRGYTLDERILYGSGQVTPTAQIPSYAQTLLANPDIAFVDVRSATNNCFQCRVRRAS